jgi:hypothetical protein
MTNIATIAAPAKKQVQDIIAVTPIAKAFVRETTETFGAPSKSKDFMNATEKEVVDAMVQFIEKNRFAMEEQIVPVMDENGVQKLDENGQPEETIAEVEIDLFGRELQGIMKERMSFTRVNTATARIAELEAQLAALLAAKGE